MLSRVKRRVTDYFCDFLSSLDSWGVDQVQFSLQRWWTGLEVPAHEIADAKSHYRRSDVNTEKFMTFLVAPYRRSPTLAIHSPPCKIRPGHNFLDQRKSLAPPPSPRRTHRCESPHGGPLRRERRCNALYAGALAYLSQSICQQKSHELPVKLKELCLGSLWSRPTCAAELWSARRWYSSER